MGVALSGSKFLIVPKVDRRRRRRSDGIVNANSRIDPRERPMESEHFSFVLIKHMCCKSPVCSEPLTSQRSPDALVMFRHVTDVVALRVHDHVSVCLFEATAIISWVPISAEDIIPYIMTFISSNCRVTTMAEFARSLEAGCLSLRTPFGSSGM